MNSSENTEKLPASTGTSQESLMVSAEEDALVAKPTLLDPFAATDAVDIIRLTKPWVGFGIGWLPVASFAASMVSYFWSVRHQRTLGFSGFLLLISLAFTWIVLAHPNKPTQEVDGLVSARDNHFWKRIFSNVQFGAGVVAWIFLSFISGLATFLTVNQERWDTLTLKKVGAAFPFMLMLYGLTLLTFVAISSYLRRLDFSIIPGPTRERFKTMLAKYVSSEDGLNAFAGSLCSYDWAPKEKQQFIVYLRNEGFSYFDQKELFSDNNLVDLAGLVEGKLLSNKAEAGFAIMSSSFFTCVMWAVAMFVVPPTWKMLFTPDGKFNALVFNQVGVTVIAFLSLFVTLVLGISNARKNK